MKTILKVVLVAFALVLSSGSPCRADDPKESSATIKEPEPITICVCTQRPANDQQAALEAFRRVLPSGRLTEPGQVVEPERPAGP